MSAADATPLLIRPEPTPNPSSIRFVLNRTLLERGVADFAGPQGAAGRSPLAAALFALNGVTGVLLGRNFVTVSLSEDTPWGDMIPQVKEAIRAHIEAGGAALIGEPDPMPDQQAASETAKGIIRVLEAEIRPAVAMDGGDVVFGSYENGIVRLQLRGACSGCPSSTMTLKMGIERRLKEEFPDIVSVEAM